MIARSRYDELHDKYSAILTTKSGTRYERLAAMVFKALEKKNVVIHDFSLRGQSDVAHQIDVNISADGNNRRVIIECKDFDISGTKVGLGIVRNFRSVLEDTNAHEGIILTCNGFTADAAKFAQAKGIKLGVLRTYETEDARGRIKAIILTIIVLVPVNPKMTIHISNEAEKQRFELAMKSLSRPGGVDIQDGVFMSRGTERVLLNELMTKRMNEAIPVEDTPNIARVHIENAGWKIEIQNHEPLSFDFIDVVFEIHRHEEENTITSDRVAELIVSGFGEADIVIFGDQLKLNKIDPETGKVI